MNYRHAFHAGNHADVLKHVVLLATLEALAAKPAPMFLWDVHAAAGVYDLAGEEAGRTGEWVDGIGRLDAPADPLLQSYLSAVAACRAEWGAEAYPGSPWLMRHAMRAEDRLLCTELHPDILPLLRAAIGRDARVAIHAADGYAQSRAFLPPRDGATRLNRGLVLLDPPYEAQAAEFDLAFAMLRESMARWPQGTWLLWYPIKQRRALARMYRTAAGLPAKSLLCVELLVREDDSPLRLNGSGLFVWNAPWQLDARLSPALSELVTALGEPGAASRVEWLRTPT